MIKGVDFKELEEYIRRNYGPRCSEYCPGCISCSIWRTFDDLKSLNSWEDIDESIEVKGIKIEKQDTGLGLSKGKGSVRAKTPSRKAKKASNRRKK